MELKVIIVEDEPRAGTFLISQGFNREHKYIKELITKYKKDFEDFGVLKQQKLKSTGGRAANEYMLNEDQVIFLGTLMRNSDKVVLFKKLVVKKFKECRDILNNLKKTKQADEYKLTRQASILFRKETTDAMKQFIEYAESQGSNNANKYYINITHMMNSLLFIVEGRYKNLREVMSIKQLMTISSAENIVDRGLKEGMSNNKYYKDIYQDIKKRVKQFAELHGQSKIIEQDFKLLEE